MAEFKSCAYCIHYEDDSELCILRQCEHAVIPRECYEPKQPNRPTGKWERGYLISVMTGGMHEIWRCSNCKAKVLEKKKYCAECGARMEVMT